MSVIQKAMGHDGGGTPPPRQPQSRQANPSFELNKKQLREQGFFTEPREATTLAVELRMVRRRLLRRLGYRRELKDERERHGAGRKRNMVMVTSTRAGEGKTFAAINLALSFAIEDDIAVMMIDGDAPRPKLRSTFGLSQGPGFVDAILDPGQRAEQLAHQAQGVPLQILTEGAVVDRTDAIFGSVEAQNLLMGLSSRQSERLLVVDAPPVLATSEAVALARHVDEIVFVVEADETPEAAVASALDELMDVNANVSLLLNKALLAGGGAHYESYQRYERIETPS